MMDVDEPTPRDYAIKDQTCFDENTNLKVYKALKAAGIDFEQAIDAINQMQNAGILFRERCQ